MNAQEQKYKPAQSKLRFVKKDVDIYNECTVKQIMSQTYKQCQHNNSLDENTSIISTGKHENFPAERR